MSLLLRSRFPYGLVFSAMLVLIAIGWLVERSTNGIPPMPLDQQIEAGDVSISEGDRSSRWPAVRRKFLASNPCCEACGATERLHVHHVKPFSLYPELELVASNLITLCGDCHFYVGHDEDGPKGPKKPNWKTSNRSVWRDAKREKALR